MFRSKQKSCVTQGCQLACFDKIWTKFVIFYEILNISLVIFSVNLVLFKLLRIWPFKKYLWPNLAIYFLGPSNPVFTFKRMESNSMLWYTWLSLIYLNCFKIWENVCWYYKCVFLDLLSNIKGRKLSLNFQQHFLYVKKRIVRRRNA